MNYLQKVKEAASYITKEVSNSPSIGVILGTGLGNFVNKISHIIKKLDYKDIPYFPISTVESHKGELIFAELHNKQIVILRGRWHYYEGYSLREVTFPIRVLKLLGVKTLLISNAAGALNPFLNISDLMIITDHINLLPDNPLRGENYDEFGPRFPDMSEPYDPNLIDIALQIAKEYNLPVKKGVYIAVSGPNLETKAEYNFLRIIGGDAVGMSTVPEVIVANHMNIKCFAVSVITDIGYPLQRVHKVTLEDVIKAAQNAEKHLITLFEELIKRM